MVELSRTDAELVYKYARDTFRADIEAEAYTHALDAWQDERPGDFNRLQDEHADDDSAFSWDGIWLEMEQRDLDGNEDLVPLTGIEPEDDDAEELRDLAADFGWDYVNEVRDEIRRQQDETDFSPREFVALVLDAASLPTEISAHEMDVSEGNYAGKVGRVREKIEQAEQTQHVTERVRR